jgi:hypothetical protein
MNILGKCVYRKPSGVLEHRIRTGTCTVIKHLPSYKAIFKTGNTVYRIRYR